MDEALFSAATRRSRWECLEEITYDVLVIGGGITGAGVALDAACRGLRVALVEAGDLAQGTSSLSSRLIHGGLRYLETYDFRLVFEALRERRRLLELAPHLVRPLPFLFPVYRGDPTGLVKLAAGMWLYETLSLFRSPKRHRVFGRRGAMKIEPGLRADRLVGGALYFDAQVDDARLVVAVARAAHEAGADVLTRVRVDSFSQRPTPPSPSEIGVTDLVTDQGSRIRARAVVNATGPWSDRVRRLADGTASARLRTTKGVHIVVARERVGNRGALIFRSEVDGRVMFVLPWGEFTYIGTTDTEYEGDPADAWPEPADIRYLLDSANGVFPGAGLGVDDVVSTWAGVRPLLAPVERHAVSASSTSREHAIWRDASGLLNVAGGKLTTYRSMAAEVVDRIARILDREYAREAGACHTEFLPLPGAGDESDSSWVIGGEGPLDPDRLSHLRRRYGVDATRLLELISADPGLGEPIVPSRPDLRAEVVHAVRREMALSLEDVMRRRLHLCYETRDGGMSVAADIALLMGGLEELDWDAAERDRQVTRYAAVVAATRPVRS